MVRFTKDWEGTIKNRHCLLLLLVIFIFLTLVFGFIILQLDAIRVLTHDILMSSIMSLDNPNEIEQSSYILNFNECMRYPYSNNSYARYQQDIGLVYKI